MELKLFVFDVDGTLTNGTIYYGDKNLELKAFNARDGVVLKSLAQLGIDVVFLTGRISEAVMRRADELNATAIQGISDKATVLSDILDKRGVAFEETAYIGDDINDYPAMILCGFRACPVDASSEIKGIADYISPFKGGHGAVRDIVEKLLKDNGKWGDLISLYGVPIK